MNNRQIFSLRGIKIFSLFLGVVFFSCCIKQTLEDQLAKWQMEQTLLAVEINQKNRLKDNISHEVDQSLTIRMFRSLNSHCAHHPQEAQCLDRENPLRDFIDNGVPTSLMDTLLSQLDSLCHKNPSHEGCSADPHGNDFPSLIPQMKTMKMDRDYDLLYLIQYQEEYCKNPSLNDEFCTVLYPLLDQPVKKIDGGMIYPLIAQPAKKIDGGIIYPLIVQPIKKN